MKRFHQEWREDWTGSAAGQHNQAAVERRQTYLQECNKQQRRDLYDMLLKAMEGRRRIIEENAGPCWDTLELVSDVECATSMADLLDTASLVGDSELDRRARFEAISLFDQACELLEIERECSMKSIKHDLRSMLRLLREELFAGSKQLTVKSTHDPRDSFRVTGEVVLIEHKHETSSQRRRSRSSASRYDRERGVMCRVLKGTDIPVLIHPRIKDLFNTWLKIQRQVIEAKKEDPYAVQDRRGLKFVVPGSDEVNALCVSLVKIIIAHGGKIIQVTSNIGKNEKTDTDNVHSSDRFKFSQLMVEWNGSVYELQEVTFRDYLSSESATDEENHRVYAQRKSLMILFELLFPESIYGFSWDSSELRSELEEWLINSLGLRINPRRS